MPRTVVVAFALRALLLLSTQLVARAQAVPRPSLVGTWEFTLRPNSSRSTEGPVTGLATFAPSWTVIESDTSEAALHLTPGHGIWQRSPAFGSWFIRFVSLVPNPNGTLHSKRIFTLTVELNSLAEQFSGGYSLDVVDPSGHTITTGSGTVEGQLMTHPLLP